MCVVTKGKKPQFNSLLGLGVDQHSAELVLHSSGGCFVKVQVDPPTPNRSDLDTLENTFDFDRLETLKPSKEKGVDDAVKLMAESGEEETRARGGGKSVRFASDGVNDVFYIPARSFMTDEDVQNLWHTHEDLISFKRTAENVAIGALRAGKGEALKKAFRSPEEEKTGLVNWCKTARRRRGLEMWCCPEHMKDRAEIQTKANKTVLMGQTGNQFSEELARKYGQMARASSDFARAMGAADEEAARESSFILSPSPVTTYEANVTPARFSPIDAVQENQSRKRRFRAFACGSESEMGKLQRMSQSFSSFLS